MNFDALEEQLDKKLDEYRGAVFTEDTKTIAKAEIASLRRLKKDIEDGRKTVKKKWMEPYDAFDKRMKILSTNRLMRLMSRFRHSKKSAGRKSGKRSIGCMKIVFQNTKKAESLSF